MATRQVLALLLGVRVLSPELAVTGRPIRRAAGAVVGGDPATGHVASAGAVPLSSRCSLRQRAKACPYRLEA